MAVKNATGTGENITPIDRIRFIRISDLCVAKSPCSFVPIFTNALLSMVFRYQDMTERLLEESPFIDTIILRPGDLTDMERDLETTALQVEEKGTLPYPAVVGREDVAALVVESALFNATTAVGQDKKVDHRAQAEDTDARSISGPTTTNKDNGAKDKEKNNLEAAPGSATTTSRPFHMTLAVRWCGDLDPPNTIQGEKTDGRSSARQCLQKVLKSEPKECKKRIKRRHPSPTLIEKITLAIRRRPLKPYAPFVAIPVYFIMALAFNALITLIPGASSALKYTIPIAKKYLQLIMSWTLAKLLPLIRTVLPAAITKGKSGPPLPI